MYDFAHIGNARPVIVFDLLYRILIQIYGKKHVSYVRNFTDVDDKINARAKKEGIEIKALTDNTINDYLCDIDYFPFLNGDQIIDIVNAKCES